MNWKHFSQMETCYKRTTPLYAIFVRLITRKYGDNRLLLLSPNKIIKIVVSWDYEGFWEMWIKKLETNGWLVENQCRNQWTIETMTEKRKLNRSHYTTILILNIIIMLFKNNTGLFYHLFQFLLVFYRCWCQCCDIINRDFINRCTLLKQIINEVWVNVFFCVYVHFERHIKFCSERERQRDRNRLTRQNFLFSFSRIITNIGHAWYWSG